MRGPTVVEVEVSADRRERLADGVIRPQMHLLGFEAEQSSAAVATKCATIAHLSARIA